MEEVNKELIEVARMTTQVLGTCIEALGYILQTMKAGAKEPAFYLIDDVIDGYYEVNDASQQLLEGCTEYKYEGIAEEIYSGLCIVVEMIQKEKAYEVYNYIETSLIPSFRKYDALVDECYGSYICS